MRHLGGLAGTLMAILTLTWVVQGDSFFLAQMIDRTVSRARRAISGPRHVTPPSEAHVPATAAPGDAVIPPPTAVQRDALTSVPDRAPGRRGARSTPPAAESDIEAPASLPPVASSIQPRTDGRERILTVTRSGPIVERPGESDPPLLVVTEGTGLKLLDVEGEWFRVEFVDRKRGGPRVGYIHLQYVRANPRRFSGPRR